MRFKIKRNKMLEGPRRPLYPARKMLIVKTPTAKTPHPLRKGEKSIHKANSVLSEKITMVPAGYMAKVIEKRPDWLKVPGVKSIYSVSGCISKNFADYTNFWKHNKYWFFDSAEVIKKVSKENNIDLSNAEFLYYEIYEKEFNEDSEAWIDFKGEDSFGYNVKAPNKKKLLGYDIVSYTERTTPECSPLSCNSLAQKVNVNQFSLLDSFEECKKIVESPDIKTGEPGPYRILAVYKID